MTELIEMLVLAVVQGIAEFLPISSSGHLVILTDLMEQLTGQTIPEKLTVSIVLHVGTLAAVIVFYRRRIVRLLGSDRRLIGLLIVGSIPAGIVGIAVQPYFEAVLGNTLLAGCMFSVTGAMLLWTARGGGGSTTCVNLSYRDALVVGVFQAIAILPGISRSGATIVAGLGCGLRRDEAATFSFLLAIPVIGGAGLLDAVKLISDPPERASIGLLAMGAVVSFAVGLAALAWLVRWLQQGRLHRFAWWLFPLSATVIFWQLCR
ncbi:MAG: undecaprenyl-diphosphate phosphatase [Planctomycetes bacterium]|nr:undecaprenyl-diphosphate phosphatase [Planctomycetota bacterium]